MAIAVLATVKASFRAFFILKGPCRFAAPKGTLRMRLRYPLPGQAKVLQDTYGF